MTVDDPPIHPPAHASAKLTGRLKHYARRAGESAHTAVAGPDPLRADIDNGPVVQPACPSATADLLPRLQHQNAAPRRRDRPSRLQTSQTRADDQHVNSNTRSAQ